MDLRGDAGTPARRTARLGKWQLQISGPPPMVDPLLAVLDPISLHREHLPPLEVLIAPGGRWAQGVAEGRSLWSVDLPPTGWLGLLLGQVVATCAALLRRILFIHAGAVAVDGRGWVIVGQSGAGKTSSVAALLPHGAVYLSDELALLDPVTRSVVPFTLPMAVKSWTAKAVGRLPDGREVAQEGGVRFFLPDRSATSAVPAEAFILLRPGRRARLTPLSRAQMLVKLAEHQSSLNDPLRLEEAFGGFGRLLRGARCYQLQGPPAAAAVLLTRDIQGQPRPT